MSNLDMVVRETGSMFTVDARALHEWLGVRRDFSNWFKDQVERVDMVERIHYEVVFAIKGENSGGRPAKDFMITISAAKHIGMMSNTSRGKEVRRYFEACEEKLNQIRKQITPLGATLENALRQMVESEVGRITAEIMADMRLAVSEAKALSATAQIEANFVTIAGFLSITGMKHKTREEIRILGIHVAKYCRENGIKIAKVSNPQYGKVNAYPKEVLEMLIGDVA